MCCQLTAKSSKELISERISEAIPRVTIRAKTGIFPFSCPSIGGKATPRLNGYTFLSSIKATMAKEEKLCDSSHCEYWNLGNRHSDNCETQVPFGWPLKDFGSTFGVEIVPVSITRKQTTFIYRGLSLPVRIKTEWNLVLSNFMLSVFL